MSVIGWGKPKIEIAPYVNGALPATPTWATLPTPEEGTSKLTTNKGAKKEAKLEGGDTLDVKYGASDYQFECSLFITKGMTRPVTDVDGVVDNNYALRVTPEDTACEGFQMDKTAITVEESFGSDKGKMLKLVFDSLKPASGDKLKPYTVGE